MAVLTCREAYAYIGADGLPASVQEGDTVDDDNPIVKGHESKFEPFTVTHATPTKKKG